jgi:cytochrome c oxidase subunit 3/cytochrome o ubiquinol oxidase subunit 3
VEGGRLEPVKVGVAWFLLSEVAFFGTLIIAYTYFLRQTTQSDPTPAQVFKLPLVLISTACLLLSSVTIHLAERALRAGKKDRFMLLLSATILLGLLFLIGTGLEWYDLIFKWHLTISRNMFGTTYFTLVGFHAFHVTMGIVVMSIMLSLYLRRRLGEHDHVAMEAVSWYWHFVDAVWVVVFSLVYIVGR